MSSLGLLLTLLLGAEPVAADEQVTNVQIRAAVERSLPFLLTGGEKWRDGTAGGGQNGRVCVTCHQIPFTLWSHNEAKLRGLAIEQKRVDDLATWTLDWCAVQKSEKTNKHTGGFLATMHQLILGREETPPEGAKLETYALFGQVIDTMQKPEGGFRNGNQIKGKGTEREADDVDTMWVLLGLHSLEKIPGMPAETRELSAKDREKAWTWLKSGPPGSRTDWVALRMLSEREFGEPAQVEERLKQLLALQNADGGWSLLPGEPSHPLVTGECLYALNIVGRNSDDSAVRAGCKFLVNSQQEDGSWKAVSRNEANKLNIVTTHWGTGWATIGLVRSLPQ